MEAETCRDSFVKVPTPYQSKRENGGSDRKGMYRGIEALLPEEDEKMCAY